MTEEDDIARWASSLTPDGTPGIMAQRMREYLGDQEYEKVIAQNDSVVTGQLQRLGLVNNLLSLLVVYGTLFGLVGLVGAVVFVIHFIFS